MGLAGGGIPGGQVIGKSDRISAEPVERPITPEDVWATMYHQLGIDANQELLAFGTRPIEMIIGGKLIDRIVA